MISGPTTPARRRLAAHATALTVAAGCVMLRLYPPETSRLYPLCPVYRTLHLLCPGCGATRALAALLRGDLPAAVHANLLFVALLPLLLAFAGLSYRRALAPGLFCWPRFPPAVTGALLALAAAFAAIRNLPGVHL